MNELVESINYELLDQVLSTETDLYAWEEALPIYKARHAELLKGPPSPEQQRVLKFLENYATVKRQILKERSDPSKEKQVDVHFMNREERDSSRPQSSNLWVIGGLVGIAAVILSR